MTRPAQASGTTARETLRGAHRGERRSERASGRRPAAGRARGRRGIGLLAALTGMALLAACNAPRVAEPTAAAQAPGLGELPQGRSLPTTDAMGRPIAPETLRVGLLLPLSGQGSEVGQAMRNAAELALFEAGDHAVQLLPRDTAGTPDGAARAARDALDSGATLILGPLFRDGVGPVAGAAGSAGVNVVAYTTDASVAGGNAFVMGILPGAQVSRVVDYAVGQGLTRFAAAAPANEYGRAVLDALSAAARTRGATTAELQTYPPDATDFGSYIQALARGPAPDAVLLPDGGLRLRQVAPLVDFYGLTRARLLGTGQWDDPTLQVERSLYGGWFAAPDPARRADFERRYATFFGATPPRLATLAYDSVAFAVALSRDGSRPAFTRTAITRNGGFVGLDGIFRFGETGRVERGLAVLEMTADGPVVVDPAPEGFGGPAF